MRFDGAPAGIIELAPRSEEHLVASMRELLRSEDAGKWQFGREAAEWCLAYSRGRGDADLAKLVGCSQQTVNYRRRVWERFGSYHARGNLRHLHFRVALAWPDADEWLARANDEFLSASEMQEQHEAAQATREDASPGEPEPCDSIPHVSHNSGRNEWYTPPDLIAAAKCVMGGIDLDPASSEIANRTVRAGKFFTAEDDGLTKNWGGRVWLNPPYAQPLISQFAKKLINEIQRQRVTQACVLVNNATETTWFSEMFVVASCVCFPRGRVRFVDAHGKPGSPLQGQAVLYCGDEPRRFAEAFEKFGPCVPTRFE